MHETPVMPVSDKYLIFNTVTPGKREYVNIVNRSVIYCKIIKNGTNNRVN